MGEKVHVQINRKMAEQLAKIDPDLFALCSTYEKGKLNMYAKRVNSLYGVHGESRLFWEKLTSQLQKCGFVSNLCDTDVMNKAIHGKQCTITWHVHDLKIYPSKLMLFMISWTEWITQLGNRFHYQN